MQIIGLAYSFQIFKHTMINIIQLDFNFQPQIEAVEQRAKHKRERIELADEHKFNVFKCVYVFVSVFVCLWNARAKLLM